MIIRPALVEDSRGIALVHVSSWQHAYRGIVPRSYLDQLSVANREKQWVEVFERGSSGDARRGGGRSHCRVHLLRQFAS